MKKKDEVRQEFARAAEAVRSFPAWMQELGQQRNAVKKQSANSTIVETKNPRPAQKRRK
jgi:hypothetical protein